MHKAEFLPLQLPPSVSVPSGAVDHSSGPGSVCSRSLHTYRLSARSGASRKPSCDILTSTGHDIRTDLPKLSGGADKAPQPVELMVASLLGCKTATAHFVARHLWPRPHNKIDSISFLDVVAERDDRGALTLPITEEPPITAGLLRVTGKAVVSPVSTSAISSADVAELGALVEKRCPVAAMFHASGCSVDFTWVVGSGTPEQD